MFLFMSKLNDLEKQQTTITKVDEEGWISTSKFIPCMKPL